MTVNTNARYVALHCFVKRLVHTIDLLLKEGREHYPQYMHFFVLFGTSCMYDQKAIELEQFMWVSFPKSCSPQVHTIIPTIQNFQCLHIHCLQ